jgi:tRNA 5-methylaminomethyl-2-thiouridine biosynthesis bifunctional protein
MSGGGTLVPAGNGTVVAGATYEFATSAAPLGGERAHRSNVERLARLLAAPVDATPCGLFDAVRCVARDRLPLAGAVGDEDAALRGGRALQGAHLADLPRVPGLYASFAFGSRGLALAPLAAEWIAAQLEGEPWPVERDLAARIDGARFLLRVVRRG